MLKEAEFTFFRNKKTRSIFGKKEKCKISKYYPVFLDFRSKPVMKMCCKNKLLIAHSRSVGRSWPILNLLFDCDLRANRSPYTFQISFVYQKDRAMFLLSASNYASPTYHFVQHARASASEKGLDEIARRS